MSCILRGNAFPLLRGRHSSPHSGRKEEHTSFRRKRNRLHIRKWRRNPSPCERKEETLIHFHHLNKHLQQNAMNPALQQTLRKTLYRHVETEHFVLLAPFKLLHSTSNRMGQINTKALRENIEGSVWRWGNENERTLQVESFVEADLVVSIVDEEGMEEWCESGSSENAISTCWVRWEGIRLLLLRNRHIVCCLSIVLHPLRHYHDVLWVSDKGGRYLISIEEDDDCILLDHANEDVLLYRNAVPSTVDGFSSRYSFLNCGIVRCCLIIALLNWKSWKRRTLWGSLAKIPLFNRILLYRLIEGRTSISNNK